MNGDLTQLVITLSNLTRTDRVITYFKKSWNVEKIFEKIIDLKIWIAAYVVKHNEYTIAITSVYRSPSSNETEFLGVFEEVLEEMNELNCDILSGDFNIDWCKNGFYKNKMQCLLHNNVVRKR